MAVNRSEICIFGVQRHVLTLTGELSLRTFFTGTGLSLKAIASEEELGGAGRDASFDCRRLSDSSLWRNFSFSSSSLAFTFNSAMLNPFLMVEQQKFNSYSVYLSENRYM